MNRTIFINGTRHNCEWVSNRVFFADTPELPHRRCSQHAFADGSARMHMENGGTVFSSGNRYSMRPALIADAVDTLPEAEDTAEDVWDQIAQCAGYTIGGLMAFVFLFLLLTYVYNGLK